MDKGKIDEAVRVMQTLTLEERAVVNYTVDRESKRRIRNRNKPKEVPALWPDGQEEKRS